MGEMKLVPVGLIPQWLHQEQRIKEILEAMHRYVSEGVPVPLEWQKELEILLSVQRVHRKNKTQEGE